MVTTRRKFSQDASLRTKAIASAVAVGAAFTLSALPAMADDPVAADGAVGVNASWEAGTSEKWFVELQRQGIYSIDDGIRSENDAEIRVGLHEFDWAFAHQGADGSFPGTAGGRIGQEYHSSSLFLEAAARAALELKSYSPMTYQLDSAFYDSKVAQYAKAIHAAAVWMTSPAILPAALVYDAPFTHRRYLSAATLAEAGALTGDSELSSDAVPFVMDGLSRQLGVGWTAAITKNADGTFPPAVLQAPGVRSPANTYETLSAVGVNPEKFGYDTEYQALGLFYANTYYRYCTDPVLRKQLRMMTRAALNWESAFVNDDGSVGSMGDSRVGVETNREGDVKQTTKGVCWGAFDLGAQNTGDAIDDVYATRIAMSDEKIDTNVVHTYGAVDYNEAWEHDKSLPWNIGNQKIGADFVETGIAEENDAVIQKGLLIFSWGFNHQKDNGSFGTSVQPCAGTAGFIEAAARAADDLAHYNPQTYQPTTNYSEWAADTLSRCVKACNWLNNTSDGQQAEAAIAKWSSRDWAVAAAFSEVGSLTSDASLQSQAQAFAAKAIALQLPSGEDPENGVADVNNQAVGLGFALHYAGTCTDASSVAATVQALDKGLTWESQYIGVDGIITGSPSPARLQIQHTFGLAATLPAKTLFQIVRYRLGDLPVE